MPGRISRVPGGLLGLLDLKTMGQSPQTLSETLLGTLETFPFYCNTLQETTFTASMGAALGVQACTMLAGFPLGPGAGAVWYVRSFQLLCGGGVAGTINARACIIPANQAGGITLGAYYGNLASGTVTIVDVTSQENFWMMPGDRLGYYVSVTTGGANAVQGQAIYSEFAY